MVMPSDYTWQRGVDDPLAVTDHLSGEPPRLDRLQCQTGETKRSPDSSAIPALADADYTIPSVIDADQRTRLDR